MKGSNYMSTTTTPETPVSPDSGRSATSIVKVVFASLIGTAVEWYGLIVRDGLTT